MDAPAHLELSPPARRKPDRGSFDVRPRAVRRWLADLPLADPARTARELLVALQQVNQLHIRHRTRLRFLETVRPTVAESIAVLGRHHPAKVFPLPERSRKLAECAESLLLELGIGYHSVVQELASRRSRRQAALPLQRAIHALGHLLFDYGNRYAPPPPELWRNLHRLYRLAEEHGIADLSLPDSLAQTKRRSIADTYKQILLLAAAGPYRLRPTATTDVYAIVERWARHTRLLGPLTGHDGQAAFSLDLESDQPPTRHSTTASRGKTTRLLDTSPLAAIASQEKKRASWWRFWRRPEPASQAELMRHLAATLGLPPLRQSIRLPVSASMDVFIGLSQIHRGLADYHGIDGLELDTDSPHFAGRDLRNELRSDDDDIWSLIYPAELLRRLTKEPQSSNAPAPEQQAVHGQSWTLVNTSASGYCLQSDPAQTCKAQIGDLVAIRERGDKRYSWQLGIIRWMQQSAHGLQVGIQVLGIDPVPILAIGLERTEPMGPPARSLLLPAEPATGRLATLLTMPFQHDLPLPVLLRGPAGEHEISLTRLLGSCNGFAQFEYQAARAATIAIAQRRPLSVV